MEAAYRSVRGLNTSTNGTETSFLRVESSATMSDLPGAADGFSAAPALLHPSNPYIPNGDEVERFAFADRGDGVSEQCRRQRDEHER